jgi:hypothetical protein
LLHHVALNRLQTSRAHHEPASAELLITESTKDFAHWQRALADQIRTIGPVENHYVDDSAYVDLEIKRLRRIAAVSFNICFGEALENLLKQLLSKEDYETHRLLFTVLDGRRHPEKCSKVWLHL